MRRLLAEELRGASYSLQRKRQRSSIVAEFLWLAYFFAVFAIGVYAMVLFVVPHHFNDKVAITLAGMFAALVMISTRAWWTARSRR